MFALVSWNTDFVFVVQTWYFRGLNPKLTPLPKILSINQPNLPF